MPISAPSSPTSAYQEGTEHVEADEVEDSEAAAAGRLPLRAVAGLRLWGTLLAWHTGQHDILPGLPGGTPTQERRESPTSAGHSPRVGKAPKASPLGGITERLIADHVHSIWKYEPLFSMS